MEKCPILKKCLEAEGEKVTFEKYLGLNQNKEFYNILEKDIKQSTKNNFKDFLGYLSC